MSTRAPPRAAPLTLPCGEGRRAKRAGVGGKGKSTAFASRVPLRYAFDISAGAKRHGLRNHPRRNQGQGRRHPPQPAAGAQCAQRHGQRGTDRRDRRLRGRRRDRLRRHHRQREGVRGRRRHQGDGGQVLHGRLQGRLRRQLGPRRAHAQAGDRGGRGLRARRRLRARDDVRHDHRGRQREVRSARDQARRHPGHRRHAAPHARGRQGEGDGPEF